MANKRMFALSIVDTDKFLEMPLSARYLYYELGMRGDDDGFVANPKKILRATGCRGDDLKKLAEEGYIKIFDTGILVITDWKTNNYIRADRYKPTLYQREFELFYGIPVGIPTVCVEQNSTIQTKKEQQQEKIEQIIEKYQVQKTVDILVNQGFGTDQIDAGLLLLSNEGNVRKPGAWLRRAVEEGWIDPDAERREKERQINEAITAAAKEVMEKERLETEREPVENDFLKEAMKRHKMKEGHDE